jgi:hypothetical protein
MTPPRTDSHVTSLRDALEHAQRLTDRPKTPSTSAAWSAQAAHVGDLAILALAMRD